MHVCLCPLQMYKQDIEEAIRDSVSGDAEDAYLGLGIDYILASCYSSHYNSPNYSVNSV